MLAWVTSACARRPRRSVLEVYTGNVRWRDATPAERAVWVGRPRNPETWTRYGPEGRKRSNEHFLRAYSAHCDELGHQWIGHDEATTCTRCLLTRHELYEAGAEFWEPRPRQPRPGLHGYRERMWWNIYDTVTIPVDAMGLIAPRPHGPASSNVGLFRAFTNTNIGDFERTNCEVGGQFAGETFVVVDFYVVPKCSADHVPWDAVSAKLIVGNKHATPLLPLPELFMGCALWERPYVIPVRQSYCVEIWRHRPISEPLDLVVHLEGLLTRDVA